MFVIIRSMLRQNCNQSLFPASRSNGPGPGYMVTQGATQRPWRADQGKIQG